ncbi:MAG: glycosyltransferase [Planctomycetia bacterium]|nr:glycosyltransferase [Planctomycetia bacterium]
MTTPLTILIDLRVAQFNGDRGIPAYSQSLAAELCRAYPAHRWLLLQDERFPPSSRAAELAAHGTWCTAKQVEAEASTRIDALITGCFFLPHHQCGADFLLPPWLRRQQPRRLGIVYDLIPLLFPDRYLAHEQTRRQYENCLGLLRGSDHLFGISRSTCRDTIRHAAIDPGRVHCIYGDIDHRKRELMQLPAGDTAAVPASHDLVGPYCVFIGGDDWRKNLEGMVRGFAVFHRDHPDHQLAIVCTISADSRARLRRLAAELGLPDRAVVCTGYVTTEDLVGLLRHATMLVYPSLYEGLGLPILEAYGCGVPAVGSATSSVGELLIPELAFDPAEPVSIAATMRRLLAEPGLAARSLAFGRELLAGLGWSRAAAEVMRHLDDTPQRRPQPGRLAVVAALPPAQTAIARYTVRHLQPPSWRTDFFDANSGPTVAAPDGLLTTSRVLPVEVLRPALDRGPHSTVIHVLGNSPHHVKVLDALMRSRRAGRARRLAYLHEANLGIPFRRWLGADYHLLPAAEPVANAAAWIRRALTRLPEIGRCLRFLAEYAELDGLIVNSAACRDLVRSAIGSFADRWTIDVALLPVESPTGLSARPDHGKPRGRTVDVQPLRIGSFGITGDGKRLDCVAKSVALLARRRPARLVIAGWRAARYCRRTGIDLLPCVEVHDSPDDDQLLELMRGVDVAVQLREMSHGESSAAAGQLLGLGKQLVVTNEGSFAELPPALTTFVSADCTPSVLAQAIEAASRRDIDDSDLATILAAHSPAAFTARLGEILNAA